MSGETQAERLAALKAEDARQEASPLVCLKAIERGYGPAHYWRWDRARCEMCSLDASDYVQTLEDDRDAKAALLDDAVKALERFTATYKYHDAAVGCLWSCFEADVENAQAILTRLRDVPVHSTQ